jgi:hypothetical protein
MSGLLEVTVTVPDDEDQEITVGAATEITVVGQSENDELYDPEELTFSEVVRREVAFQAEVTFREFDEQFGQYWLGGGDASAGTSLSSATDPVRVELTVKQGMTDYDNTAGTGDALSVTLSGAYVDGDMPLLEMSQGEYNEHSVTLRGNGITYERVTDA